MDDRSGRGAPAAAEEGGCGRRRAGGSGALGAAVCARVFACVVGGISVCPRASGRLQSGRWVLLEEGRRATACAGPACCCTGRRGQRGGVLGRLRAGLARRRGRGQRRRGDNAAAAVRRDCRRGRGGPPVGGGAVRLLPEQPWVNRTRLGESKQQSYSHSGQSTSKQAKGRAAPSAKRGWGGGGRHLHAQPGRQQGTRHGQHAAFRPPGPPLSSLARARPCSRGEPLAMLGPAGHAPSGAAPRGGGCGAARLVTPLAVRQKEFV
jgi:hypothetical protein